jgi:UDP:flavonoid glycosyltransferase YjiC (YdhE family)
LRSILYYITGHGYGHAVRSIQVIRALQETTPDLQVHVRTTAPQWLFASLPRPVSYTSRSIDVGVIQPDSLRMDLAATLAACDELQRRMPQLLHEEIEFVQAQNIDLIIGDIPPACFEVAARAKLPSVAITNFTWDMIYQAYAGTYPEFTPIIEEMRKSYAKAALALSLPYACDMSIFPRRESIPWITRCSSLTRTQARAAFDLPQFATIVLLSFGGIGLDPLPLQRLQEMSEFHFVATGTGKSQDNFQILHGPQRRYEDLLRAVDVVVTKPGYGIVADVLAHRVPILYTERGEFSEYPFLVAALNDLATAEFIPQAALRSGNLRTQLRRLLDTKPNRQPAQLNGASKAAEHILAFMHTGASAR